MNNAWPIFILGLAVAGCSDSSKQDYSDAGKAAGQAAQKVGKAIKTDAEIAADKIKKTAADSKIASPDTVLTAKIKQALLSANGLEAKGIDVSIDNKIIKMTGTVPDISQKNQATSVATGIAGKEYVIANELTFKKD